MRRAAGPVLLWGRPTDLPLAAVATELDRLGVPMLLVDPDLAAKCAIEPGPGSGGQLCIDGMRCDLASLRSAYLRPEASPQPAFDDALAGWLELTPALVVNRLSTMSSNGSKPYQAALIREAGLRVPETLVTNDAAALREFRARHCELIYKSISGVRSIVSRLGPRHDGRWADLATCPTQFQAYVPGQDHRVHVIGDALFGHRIDCEADDYRYASDAGGVRIEPWPVPDELAPVLRGLARRLGLSMAGIDLRRRPDGEWFCFEVNPSPGFTYYDDEEDMPLARAAARLLSEG